MAIEASTTRHISSLDYDVFSQDLLFAYEDLWSRLFDENEVLRHWSQQQQPWHLYCSAPPRAGKTTFTAAVARHLQNQHRFRTVVVTIYLDLLEGKVGSSYKTLQVVFRAILQQLVHAQFSTRRNSPGCSEELTGSCHDTILPLDASLENLSALIKVEIQNFDNVFVLVDGVNQCHTLSWTELREHLISLNSVSVLYVGLPLSLLSYEKQYCDACSGKPVITLWAECEICNICYCQDCFGIEETCCSNMLSPIPIVELALDTQDYPWRAYVERRLRDATTEDETIDDLVETIGKESGYSFPLAKLCVDTLIEGNAMEEIAALRDRLPSYQLRYFNYALRLIRNQPMAEDVSLGLAAVSLIALAGTITLSFRELQAALRELKCSRASFGNGPINRERVSRVTQGWLRESREEDTVYFFTDSVYAYVHSECEDFHQEALPTLSNPRDFGLICLEILVQPISLVVLGGMAEDLHNILTRLQAYPFLAYAFDHWPEHLRNYSTKETFVAVNQLLDQFHSSKLQYISQVMAGEQWTIATIGHKLHIIANLGITSAIEHHITHATVIDIADPGTGRTPIMVACAAGHTDTVRELLRRGANLTSRCRFNRTALGYAVRMAHFDVIKCFLDEGISTLDGVGDEKEDNVLILAIELYKDEEGSKRGKREEIVKALLEMEGQEISQTGRNGKTVLHRAADLVDLSSLRLILDVAKYKMAIDTPEDNEIRRTALMNVLQSRVTSVTAETRYEAVKVMISNGASTEHTDGIGRSLIHYLAASDDFANILIMLIDDGINLQVQDARGWSPLHVACAHDCPRIVTVLIKSKCPIAVVTKAGLTPLAMAKSVRSNSVIELLLEAQTSSSNEEEQCKQVMQQDLVRTHDHTEKVDVLGNTTLHRAVLYTHDTHEVQRLLKSGQTDINSVNMYKQTALHLALQRLDQCTSAEEEDEREQDTAISIVNILIGHPKIALNIPDHWHDEVLDVAIRLPPSGGRARDIILDLLTAGAEFTRIPDKIDALMYGALVREAHPKPHLIRKLLDAGANIFRQFPGEKPRVKENKYPWQIASDRKMHPMILSQLEAEQSRRLQPNVVCHSP